MTANTKIQSVSATQPASDFEKILEVFKAGEGRAALALMDAHLAHHPAHADGWHLKGVIGLQMGDFALAADSLRRATALANSPGYFSNLALALKGLGDTDGALAAINHALALAPNMPEAHNNLGNMLIVLGKLPDAIAAYQNAVALRPTYQDALENLARAFRTVGQHTDAVSILQTVVQANPRSVAAHFELANAFKSLGDIDNAIAAYSTVIALAPNRHDAHNNLGAMLGAKRRVRDAIPSFEAAVRLKPDYIDAWINLVSAHRVTDDPTGAEDVFRQALIANPGNGVLLNALGLFFRDLGRASDAVEVLKGAASHDGTQQAELFHTLGTALKSEGKLDEAIDAYTQAITLRPDYADALNNLGIALKEKGDIPGAEKAYRTAIEANPDLVDSYNNLGVILKIQGKLEDAIEQYRKAITVRADYPEAYSNMGSALSALGRPAEALVELRRALALRPTFPEAFNNMGVTYMEQGKADEAFAAFAAALEVRPIYTEASSNMAVLLVGQGRIAEAYAYYDAALKTKPDFVDAHWNRSLAYLLEGRFDIGWDEYRWRWKRAHAVRQHYPGPEWDGQESLEGKTLVMVHEQGLGDNLQFVRYVQKIRELGGRAVIHVPREIHSLVSTIGDELVVSEPEDTGPYHFHIPMLCLARVLKTDLTSIPGGVPYLHPTPEAKARWQQHLAGLTGFKVGIVWRGRPEHKNDRIRSMTALQFCRFLGVPGLSVVNLQKDARQEELALMRRLIPNFFDAAPNLNDFMDTAAAIANLDLVICVDTSVAHAAGAIGAPVWTLLPHSPDWRWMLEREDTPWYPTMRLFRQPRTGDWASVIERVQGELTAKAAMPAPKKAAVKTAAVKTGAGKRKKKGDGSWMTG